MKRNSSDGPTAGGARGGRTNGKSVRPAGLAGSRLVLRLQPTHELIRAAGLRGTRARDFEDFVADEAALSSRPGLPDPGFREGLRRRLWRIQVLARGNRGLAPH